MLGRFSLSVLLTLAVACASAGSVPEPEAADDAALKDAAARGRELIKEGYSAIRRARVDGLVTLLGEEALVIGPGPADVYGNRSDAVLALQSVLRGKKKHKLVSKGLVVVASPSGRAAWATDHVQLNGQSFRATFVLEEADEIWSIVAVHVARDVPQKQLSSLAAGKALPELAELPGETDDGAREVADLAGEAAAEPELWLEQLADRPEVLILGSGAREITRGVKAIRKLWQGSKKKPGKLPRAVEALGLARARTTADRSLAWVALNGRSVGGDDDEPEWPSRLFAVYERGSEGWQLVMLQLAVAPRP